MSHLLFEFTGAVFPVEIRRYVRWHERFQVVTEFLRLVEILLQKTIGGPGTREYPPRNALETGSDL